MIYDVYLSTCLSMQFVFRYYVCVIRVIYVSLLINKSVIAIFSCDLIICYFFL